MSMGDFDGTKESLAGEKVVSFRQDLSASSESPAAAASGLHTVIHLLLILAAVGVVFGQTACFDKIDFDDGSVISGRIVGGFTLESVWGAFTKELLANWMPITILSYLLDAELFGAWPGGYHLGNVFYHALAAMALYAALRALTGHAGRSLLVALLFAIHPLRAESVAWISERKDVLCGVFWFLGLWAYAGYVRNTSLKRYSLVFFLTMFALMCKSMAVTLPCTLLLLDWWPLRRLGAAPFFSRRTLVRCGLLVGEKAPLFLLAVVGSCLTIVTQSEAKAMASLESVPIPVRIGICTVNYLRYLSHFFFPVRLSFFYPFPEEGYPLFWVAVAVVILAGCCAACLLLWRTRFLMTGWLWFLGTLVPVIGLVQVGSAGMADRYTYVPSVGLAIILSWMVPESFLKRHRGMARTAAGVLTLLLIALAWKEVGYYRDTETLFRRAMAVTENNYTAYQKIGQIHMERGEIEEAFQWYNRAYSVYPRGAESNYNMGSVLIQQGEYEAAAGFLQRAVRMAPGHALAQTNLGVALIKLGRRQEAMIYLAEGVRLLPEDVNAHINYGVGLLQCGEPEAAFREFEQALRLDPGNEAAQMNLELARKALARENTAGKEGAPR